MADAPAVVDAGLVGDFRVDGANDRLAKSGVILVRQNGRLFAVAAVCTHKGGEVASAGSELRCGKHGAKFSLDGMVIKGPAKRALAHFGISLNADQHVIVDRTKSFDEKRWNDAGSFIRI